MFLQSLKERKKTLDDFDRCVIKRTVHSMYNRKIVPTVSKIKKEIEDTIKISKSKLTLTLLDLGYKSLACSFTQIIWGITWSSPGLLKLKNLNRFNTMFLQSFDKFFVLPILAMSIYMLRCQKIGL
jgi:hypothetical protein